MRARLVRRIYGVTERVRDFRYGAERGAGSARATTAMGDDKDLPGTSTDRAEVDTFLERMARLPAARAETAPGGRLLFALDATASRQPTWDRAARIQGEMFLATQGLGGLAIQLCCFRGLSEFLVSPWLANSLDLLRLMTSVTCRAGETQLRKVLKHALNETKRRPIGALVYVGDCFEEDIDRLAASAGELGLLGVPAFMFHEGHDPVAAFAFKEIARLTRGVYHRFDASSPDALRALLTAAAVYSVGGKPALTRHAARHGDDVKRIARQLTER